MLLRVVCVDILSTCDMHLTRLLLGNVRGLIEGGDSFAHFSEKDSELEK